MTTLSTFDTSLSASASTIWASTSGMQYMIIKASVTNNDSNTHQVTVYRVPSGGTPGASYIFGANRLSVAAGTTVVLQLSGQAIVNGQTLQALADTAGLVTFNLTVAQVM